MTTKKVAKNKLLQVFSVHDRDPGAAVTGLIESVQVAAEGRNFSIDWKVVDNAMMEKKFCAIAVVEWIEE
jgi:hypothetical protein